MSGRGPFGRPADARAGHGQDLTAGGRDALGASSRPAAQRLGASDCERLRDGPIAQPVNTLTSAAYVVAGGLVAADPPPERRAEVLGYAALLGLVGVGSIAFHGPQPRGSRVLHDAPIAALLGLVAITPLVRLRSGRGSLPGWSPRRAGALAVIVGAAVAAYAGGRTGASTCRPESPWQLHGAWHVLSATGFVTVAEIMYGGTDGR